MNTVHWSALNSNVFVQAKITDDTDDPEVLFLKSLTPKQKKRLLK